MVITPFDDRHFNAASGLLNVIVAFVTGHGIVLFQRFVTSIAPPSGDVF